MNPTFLIAAALAVVLSTSAGAGPVERSLRPEARPTAAAAGTVTLSLRPATRPATLATSSRAAPQNAGFARWLAGFRARARAQGIRDDVLARAFRRGAL